MEKMETDRKRELRKKFLALRAAYSRAEHEAQDAAICRNLGGLPAYRESSAVAIYASDGNEPDLFALAAGSPEKRFFLPRYVAAEKRYELVEVRDFATELVRAKYGLLEPRPELPAADPEFVAREMFFITPAVACDRAGVRLGRGGGFYDRLLCGVCRPAAAAVYDCCLSREALPREMHDHPVDFVVTEREICNVRKQDWGNR